MPKKKVIFLMVDSLIPSVLERELQARTVPALQFLRDRGQYRSDVATVFPTMTASVDSSLLTGTYPDKHKVPSLIWYNPETKEIVNYLNGMKCVYKLGVDRCTQHVLYELNEKHLNPEVTTIFEELADRKLTSASINMIIHRGVKKHQLSIPFFVRWISGMKNVSISGPDILTIGRFAYPKLFKNRLHQFHARMHQRYGINDDYAIKAATELIHANQLPDFMMVYLPDNDHAIHKDNPEHGELALIHVDKQLQRVLSAFGNWDKALEQCCFIVTSDHGQTRVGREEEFNINLDDLFADFHQLKLGERVTDQHQLVVCNNERMVYLYPLQEDRIELLIERAKQDARIDLIAWKEGKWVHVCEGGSEKQMRFKPMGAYIDPYNRTWSVEGDTSILDVEVYEDDLRFRDYPDAFSRLYGALFSQDCPMVVLTARPRYEFKSRYHPTHNQGGSHGSLHKLDSTVPLIVTGAETDTPLPTRLVELKSYILHLFGDGNKDTD